MIETLGPYKILERIGAGGWATSIAPVTPGTGGPSRSRCCRRPSAATPDRRERFLRDARATAALSHPNIATLYEVGEDQDQVFLVFDFVPGQTLKAIIGGHPLNPRRAIDLAAQIADALAEAHAAGIVHGDLKPDNVIVTPRGNAKLLDFGLAAWTGGGADRGTSVTGADAASATTSYLSPEQVLGDTGDDRTDIFSLGVILFEMLTGRLPFTGPTRSALELQIMQAPAPAPSAVNRSLPPELDAIVSRALAKDIDQRYASRRRFAAELRAVAAILEVRNAANEQLVDARRSAPGTVVGHAVDCPRADRRARRARGRRVVHACSMRISAQALGERGSRHHLADAGLACRGDDVLSTCETKPTVGIDASAGSFFIAVTVPSGSVRGLLRSKITSDGALLAHLAERSLRGSREHERARRAASPRS